ncbi:MAG: signal peptidase I, partial [Bacillus sp. (in: firmicutes)]
PKGEVFVMGDNRRFSKDSRHIGTVSFDKIIGKTSFVYWPLNDAHIVTVK